MARKETPDVALFARLRTLFQTTDAESLLTDPSSDLLSYLRKAPLAYGFWGDFKRLYKAAENAPPGEPLAILLSRLDTVPFPKYKPGLPQSVIEGQADRIGRMAFEGGYFYALSSQWNDEGLRIFDMTHPVFPTLVGTVKLTGLVDMAVQGTKVYLLEGTSWNGKGKLYCYDVSVPSAPQKEAEIEIKKATRLVVSGSVAAVLISYGDQAGMQLIDISQPDHFSLLGRLPFHNPTHLQVAANSAYVIEEKNRRSSSLVLADISNPLQPIRGEELSVPVPSGLAVQGRYAYLTNTMQGRNNLSDEAGLTVIDLTPQMATGPRKVDFIALGKAEDVAVSGKMAYVSVGRQHYNDKDTGGLRIVDISEPVNPRLVGTFVSDEASHVAVQDEIVCLTLTQHWDRLLRIFDVSEPARPLLLGISPKRETLAYMKRRGRRFLRTLALRNPEAYIQAATKILSEAGQAQAKLDTLTQWITMDMLYGGGTHYEQQSHGRGGYGKPRPGFSLKTREERHPELWDRYPEMAEQLYKTPSLPWQTAEAACKILRAAKIPLPALNEKSLVRFLASESPLLRSVVARQVSATLDAGKSVSADIVADTFFGGTRRHRESILRFVEKQEAENRWMVAFSNRLYQSAKQAVSGAVMRRKASLAFALLISRFSDLFQKEVTPEITAALYTSSRPDFEGWALNTFRNILPFQLPKWLVALEGMPAGRRDVAVAAVREGVQEKVIPPRVAADLTQHFSEWIREIGWSLLAHSQTPLADIAEVWTSLMDRTTWDFRTGEYSPLPGLFTAFVSPDALALFARCDFDSSSMADRIEKRPYLLPLLPVSAMEKVIAVLPPAWVVRLAGEATEEAWPGMRQAILRGPLLLEGRADFWREAFAAIGAMGSPVLIMRLLDDPELQAEFLNVADISSYLKSANPVFGPLLGAWIAAHLDLLHRDSPELLQVATHPLPEIRSRGLARVREVGMGLPFALRLLEAELPPSVTLGKTFFEALEPGDVRQTEYITALCDSPKPSVRAYGREYLTARRETIENTDLLERLSENPDTETQAFVAGQLLAHPPTADRTAAFDRAVLRGRDRGRRAKELVKTRLDKQPTPDIPLLLEMARSRTPRDADWALGQLAKLALEGVEIPGFTLDGVAGG